VVDFEDCPAPQASFAKLTVMKTTSTIGFYKLKLDVSYVLILSLIMLGLDLSAQTSCDVDTSFTDILFLVDNSGSIDDSEYDEFASIISATVNNVRSRCRSSQIGVVHYGGEFGMESAVEFDFSAINAIPDIQRQFCSTRNQFGNCSGGGGDDLNSAIGDILSML